MSAANRSATSGPSGTPRRQILLGDAALRLTGLEMASVDCVITSPPYFRLRDYQVAGQVGLEDHVEAWVDRLQPVLAELARALVPTGSLWLNLGDSYSTHPRQGAPSKSLLLGPERLVLRLADQGWILRNKIIWAKTNPIPSSVTDRLSTTYEVVYLLTRSPRYYFALDAIRTPASSPSRPPRTPRRPGRPGGVPRRWRGPNTDSDTGLLAMKRRGQAAHPLGKNPGDVWPIATARYRGAHFATYPEALVERMLLAGCPERRCAVCRRPYQRTLRRHGSQASRGPLRPTCSCPPSADGQPRSEPGLVLDPFLGAGTTALVAERHNRDWVGIELNPEFITLASQRLAAARQPDTAPDKRKEE
ncbi:site-specific DNA-methyltransferase [Mariniluteicoccus endophyticus]